MVCPTCFCTTVEDVTDLAGEQAERWRKWDSCFTMDFSYIYGGSIRTSTRSRYRQWMTHKLANWWDQFDTSGCVGCGRCITWCPVGIDITEEVAVPVASVSGEKGTGALSYASLMITLGFAGNLICCGACRAEGPGQGPTAAFCACTGLCYSPGRGLPCRIDRTNTLCSFFRTSG